MKQGGDDPGDDFVIDNLVTLSSDEVAAFEGGFLSDSGETQDPRSSEENDDDRNPQPAANAGIEKKRKRKQKEKDRKAKVGAPLPVTYWQLPDNISLFVHATRNESSQKA